MSCSRKLLIDLNKNTNVTYLPECIFLPSSIIYKFVLGGVMVRVLAKDRWFKPGQQ
jgi:hypothetical protein